MLNVAILIPTHNNNETLQRCLNYLHNLEPQPKHYLFFTNNNTDGTVETINKWKEVHPNSILLNLDFDKKTLQLLLHKNPYNIIGLARQLLLNKTRKLNVDYAIFIDDDILIADRNFISRITEHNKDIVGGAYYRSYPSGDFLCYLTFNKGKNKDTHPYILRNYLKKALFKVAATSGGCLCLSKKVIMDKRLNFFPIIDYYHTGKAGEDFSYCEGARRLGYNIWIDDTFQLCHYQIHKEARPWREKPNNKI